MNDNLLRLEVNGMSCAACVASVERIVGNVDSVKAVAVNLALNTASIQLKITPSNEVVDEIIQAIDKGGFTANQQNQSEPLRERMMKQVNSEGRKAALALILALPTIYLTMIAGDMGKTSDFDTRLLLALIMTIPVYFWSGMAFHTNAWKAIRRGGANMDVLIHLGTTVAFFWSVGVTLAGKFTGMPTVLADAEHVFFDGVVFIIGFVLLGSYLEAGAKLKATDAINSLMSLQPKQRELLQMMTILRWSQSVL